jgi:hypothetical protein
VVRARYDALRAHLAKAGVERERAPAVTAWRDALARACVAVVLLRSRPVDDGFGGVRLESTDDALPREILRGIGGAAVVDSLGSLLATTDAVSFYRGLARNRASGGEVGASFTLAAGAAPGIDLECAFRSEYDGQPLGRLARIARLRQIDTLLAPDLREWVVGKPDQADRAEAELAMLSAPGSDVVWFYVQGEIYWHVDVLGPGGRWTPATPGRDARGERGCAYWTNRATPGTRLEVRLNFETAEHLDGGPCVPGPTLGLALGDESGVLDFPGGIQVRWQREPGPADPVVRP